MFFNFGKAEKNDIIIGVGVDGQSESKELFIIPTSAFGKSNFILISDEEKSYEEYQLPLDKAEGKIMLIAEQVVRSYFDTPESKLLKPVLSGAN